MTLSGTNSYVIDCGGGEALVIDPGPPIERHIESLVEHTRANGLTVRAIAVTHGHPDHAPGATLLATATGAPVYAHPASAVVHDRTFELEGELRVGDRVLRVIDAPGHTFDHVVFYLNEARALFTGDVILGEGTVVIAPPGGAMRPYQATLQRLADEFAGARTIYGGHGPIVTDAQAKIHEYIEHRRMRERELLDQLAAGPKIIPELVLAIYGDTRSVLWPAMARQLLAYLLALQSEGRVRAEPLERPMTDRETWMLNPPLEGIVGAEQAEVIRAELGSSLRIDRLNRYRLVIPKN
jgi:glyoxylase-like metal-dependent hydrolase (beta-lactamase superfamily II)